MVLFHPTTEWSSLQHVFYRKSELYALSWGIDNLADYVAAAASHGGLVALVRDPSRLVSVGKAALLKPKILVYTSAGQLVESIPWDPSIRIVALAFNALEQLVVVLEEGQVRIYTLLSTCPALAVTHANNNPSQFSSLRPQPVEATSNAYYTQHSLGTEATETGVVDARIWSRGLVALVGARRFIEWRFPGLEVDPDFSQDESSSAQATRSDSGFSFPSIDDETRPLPVPELLPPADPSSPLASGSFSSSSSSSLPSAWSLVPPAVSSSGLTTVLIARDDTLLSLTKSTAGPSSFISSCLDLRLSRGPFHAIRPSPNGKLLALLTNDLILWVVSSDFSQSLSEFDIKQTGAFFDATRVESSLFSSTIASDTKEARPSSQPSKGGLGGSGIRAIEWCGNNTVALAFNTEVVMVGPFGDSIRYPYSGPVHLVGEVDGLRVISSDRHEFLQKVPDVSTKVFSPGSSDPAALLFDAAEQFANKSSKADETIRAIRNDLVNAIDTCLRAAAYEWDLTWQRKLLKAASFGKSFVDLYDPTPFVEMAQTLRVLNAARAYEIGIPISFDQYFKAGPTALLSRLTAQNHHLLSLRIAYYLHIRPDPILKHWARAKIARSKPPIGGSAASIAVAEERLCNEIVRKFQMATWFGEQADELGILAGTIDGAEPNPPIPSANQQGNRNSNSNSGGSVGAREAEAVEKGVAISFSEVAWTAWKAGRRNLATRLLDHEARAIDQVPLLLNMHEDKLALIKAIESGDTDLIYHVLLRLKSQLSRGDFFRLIQAPISDALSPGMLAAGATGMAQGGDAGVGSSHQSLLNPVRQHLALAANLLEAYAREMDKEMLKDFYYQDDRRTDSAILSLQEAFDALPPPPLGSTPPMTASSVSQDTDLAEKVFKLKSAMKFFSEDKERVLETKLVEEQIRLLGFQQALEKEDGGRTSFVGLSLNQTIKQCLLCNMTKKAEKLRTDFKIPEKRFWYLKLDVFVQIRDWQGLWSFANSKKSPIGYTPFIQRLVTLGQLQEAVRYLSKCSDKSDKANLNGYFQRLPNQSIVNELKSRMKE